MTTEPDALTFWRALQRSQGLVGSGNTLIVVTQEIRLMADYAPWPLWGSSGLLAEEDLPLSPELRARIKRWLNAYDDQTPQTSEAGRWMPPPGASADDEEASWVAEGADIRDAIQRELGTGYRVRYEA